MKRNFLCLFLALILCICPVAAAGNNLYPSNSDLPTQYDLRDVQGKNYVTPVKNQGMFGTCWAHAALSSAETSSMLKGGPEINLSEKALAYYSYQLQGSVDTPDEDLEGVINTNYQLLNRPYGFEKESNIYDTGGTPLTACFQMANWLGTSTEAQIPYRNTKGDTTEYRNQIVPSITGDWMLDYYQIFDNAYHLQNSELILGTIIGKSQEEFTPQVKQLILKEGSLCLSYHAYRDGTDNDYFNDSTYSQYIPSTENRPIPNHGVFSC